MAATATARGERLALEETRLARAAANGDGGAFSVLYERYERRTFNLAYCIVGSETDAADAVRDAFVSVMQGLPRLAGDELPFRLRLFTAMRSACHESLDRRPRKRSAGSVRAASPPGSNGAGLTRNPTPGSGSAAPPRRDDQEDLREAWMRLPARQREALALRSLERLAYDEIGAIMEMSPAMVAQLLSRARINLCDGLRGTVLASIGAPSRDCERALPLIAMCEDRQIEAGSRDGAWLDSHLSECERCRLGVEAMREASASFGAWDPPAAPARLLKEAMTGVAATAGADWAGEIAELAARRAQGARHAARPRRWRPTRLSSHRLAIASGLAALLLAAGLAVALARGTPLSTPAVPATVSVSASEEPTQPAGPATGNGARKRGRKKTKKKKTARRRAPAAKATDIGASSSPATAAVPATTAAGEGSSPSEPPSGTSRRGGRVAIQRGKSTSTRRSSPKAQPAPAPTVTSQPPPAPTPVAEEPSPVEESPGAAHRRREPPGKPADRPPG